MKIASIDIGTNTVILLIAEVKNNQIAAISNHYNIPRIGKGLKQGDEIKADKISDLINILSEYSSVIKLNNCEKVLATATNALRISSNASEIIKLVKDRTGIEINIVSGKEEAELSFLGAISDYHNEIEDSIVIDIGGGSTELIYGNLTRIRYLNSFHTGVVTGTERFFHHDPPLLHEIKTFEDFLSSTFIRPDIFIYKRAIAIAGTPTTLACIQKGLTMYDEDQVEGSILSLDNIFNLKEELSNLSSKEIKTKFKQLIEGREDIILAGTIILYNLMKLLRINSIIVSTKGIRYGAIISFLNNNSSEENKIIHG
jgi:exopolyphosphatase / guanosine-5'-triphosphate,3'-diphosphate pyrophosphatase